MQALQCMLLGPGRCSFLTLPSLNPSGCGRIDTSRLSKDPPTVAHSVCVLIMAFKSTVEKRACSMPGGIGWKKYMFSAKYEGTFPSLFIEFECLGVESQIFQYPPIR